MKLLKRNILAKRLLCVLLSVMMLATMVPVGVVADGYSATYTFKNVVLSGYGYNGVVDSSTGAVTLTYSAQYQELQFTLPDGVDANSLTAISFDLASGDVSKLCVKVYGDGSDPVQLTYSNSSLTLTSDTIDTLSTASSVKIGVMYLGDDLTTENIFVINSFTVTTSNEIVTYTESVLATQTDKGTLTILSGADFTDEDLYLYVNYTLNDTSHSGWGAGALCDTGWHSAVSVTVNTTGVFAISLVDLATAFLSYTYVDDTSGETVTVTNYDVSNGVVLNLWASYITFTSAQLVRVSSSSATEYTISVSECINGTVTADMDSATAGATVTLTATPDEGYELSEWNVTYGDNNTAVTVNSDGTFTMPAGNVTVSATFTAKAEEVETVKVGDVVTVDGIKYTVVATDNSGSNTGTGKWLSYDSTMLSYLSNDSEALIYVEYTSTGDRWSAYVGLQFSVGGSYPQVACDFSGAIFKETESLTSTSFSVADVVTKAENEGYSISDCYQIYSYLGGSTDTYIYSVSIIVPYEDGSTSKICTDLLSKSNMGYYQTATENEDGSITAGSTEWLSFYLDQTYSDGETVTIHISGTSGGETIRFYLSEGTSGKKSETKSLYLSGDFDEVITFTVMASDGGTNYTGDSAVYLNIKTNYTSAFTSLTLTHLGVVDGEVSSASKVKHTVSISDSTKGSVTASVETATSGTSVTLTINNDNGYSLSTLTVTDSRGNAVTVTDNTFIMPNSDVKVSATFALTGNDDCGTTIAMKSSSVRSTYIDSGAVTIEEGTSISSSAEQFELALPYAVEEGETVTVHITGTCDSKFRIWLSNYGGTKSDIVDASELDQGFTSSGGAFDLTFTLTAKGDAAHILFKAEYSGGALDNLTLTHVGITYQPSFYGRSLTMDGEIGVTYYFDMTGVTNPNEYVLETSLGNFTASDETKTIDGVTYYRYIVYVNPTQFNTNITATLTDGTTSVAVSDYSVYDYCATVLGTDDTSSELYAVRGICEAVLNYGYYASVYDNKTSNLHAELETLITNWSDPVANWSETISSEYICASDGKTKSLALDSDGIYVIISGVTSGNKYTIGDETLEVKYDTTSEVYYVEYKVPAKEMYKPFTVYENGSAYTTYSVYTYVSHVIETGVSAQYNITNDTINLCKAIYLYGQAAASYNGWR